MSLPFMQHKRISSKWYNQYIKTFSTLSGVRLQYILNFTAGKYSLRKCCEIILR